MKHGEFMKAKNSQSASCSKKKKSERKRKRGGFMGSKGKQSYYLGNRGKGLAEKPFVSSLLGERTW